MKREDVIRMAREAGFKVNWQHADIAEIKAQRYEYFAALVAAAEREAIVQMIESDDSMRWAGAAEAIRARGEK